MNRIQVAFATLVLAACPPAVSSKTLDRVVAVVGDKAITLYELEQAYTQDPYLKQGALGAPGAEGAPAQMTPREFLGRMVESMLIEQEVERQGIKVEPMEVEKAVENQRQKLGLSEDQFQFALVKEGVSLEQYRDKIKRDLIVLRLVGKEVRSEIEISEPEMRTYYQQHRDQFTVADKVFLEAVTIPWPEGAAAVERQALRRKLSEFHFDTPTTQPLSELKQLLTQAGIPHRDAEWGWFARGELRPEFEDRVRPLPAGETSPLFETPEGLFLLHLKERVTGETLPFDQVQDQIQERLYQQEVMERYGQWLERLKARSHVEIRLTDTDVNFP